MVSGTNDRFLRTNVAIRSVYEKLEPNLIFLDLVTPIKEESNAFMYRTDAVGAASDPKKETPPMVAQGAQFPEIDRSRKTTVSELTKTKGFAMRIPRDLIRQGIAGMNEILDNYERAGYWLAEAINTEFATALTTGATTSFTNFSPAAIWSAEGAAPIYDLMCMAQDMDREGYAFKMTDAFTNKAGFDELNRYLMFMDVTDSSRALMGKPEITRDSIYIPSLDATVHKVKTGMTDGYVLGMDGQANVAECHYHIDPKYSIADVSYKTIVNGAETTKTTPNFGIHFNQFEEQDTHDTVMQFWYEIKAVVTKPYGLLYGSGI